MVGTTLNGAVEELTDDSPKVDLPSEFKVNLKEHQKTLISRCIELENEGINTTRDASLDRQFKSMRGNIGIIGDKVGSGKTYSILGLIHHNERPLVMHRIVRSEMYGMSNIYAELRERQDYLEHVGMTLIVVPHSIIKQWSKCIEQIFPVANFTVVNTTKSYELVNRSTFLNKKLMLVSGTFYRRIQEFAYDEQIHFNRIVFDEADSMNVPGARQIPATFYWFVSASYKNILSPYPKWSYGYSHDSIHNSRAYQISAGISNNAFAKNIFSCFYREYSAMSRILNKIVVKNEDSFVDQSFELPEMNVEIIKCRDSGLITILNGVVNNNIISSLNAGDIRGAVAHINQANVDTETNIIDGVLKDFSIKLNNVDVAIRYTTDCIMAQEVKDRKLTALSKEKEELKKKMELVQERIRETQICTICLSSPRMKTITKCCKNSFCFECIASWLRKKPSCPLCKTSVAIGQDLFVVKDQVEQEISEIDSRPSKIGFLEKHLSEMDSENKLLIFSENDNSFISIEGILNNLNLRYAKLKGNSINRAVHEYKEGDLQVLLVNSNAYGSGLNLENTTEIVLFHKFGNEAEAQVIGRAQRPGRTHPLKVLYLLNENEVKK